MLNRKISYIKLHAPIFVPGIKNLKETINEATLKGFEATTTEIGILVKVQGKEFVVPYPAVSHFILVPETK